MNSKAVGEITEGAILGQLVKSGCTVLLPFGNNKRYDLVVDFGDGKFNKVQCKTGRYRRGCVVFNTASTSGKGKRKNYKEDVDMFFVYCDFTKKIYKIPVEEAASGGSMVLRVEPTKNKQTYANIINWASKYGSCERCKESRPKDKDGKCVFCGGGLTFHQIKIL